MKNRYPIYIPSRGRADVRLTAFFMTADGLPFYLVVEPQEEATYRRHFPNAEILVLPESNRGLTWARNWIWEHALASGAERHWQIDDNIRGMWRSQRGRRVPCHSGVALRVCEDFADRYENVALAGLNYTMFAPPHYSLVPFRLNVHVYSCTLITNALPYRFRGLNEDVDMCLQVLVGGLCTLQLNAFLVNKMPTMVLRGGQTDGAYQGDGRLEMARALERRWPGIVSVRRRFQRPQHVVDWRKFTTPLRLKPGVTLPTEPDNYGLALVPNRLKQGSSRGRVRSK